MIENELGEDTRLKTSMKLTGVRPVGVMVRVTLLLVYYILMCELRKLNGQPLGLAVRQHFSQNCS